MSLLKGVFAAVLISTTIINTSFAMDEDLPSDGSKKPITLITKAEYRSIMDVPTATPLTVKNFKALLTGIAAGAGEPSAVLSDLELAKGDVSFKLPAGFKPAVVAPTPEQISEGASALRSAITEAVSTVNNTSATGAAASRTGLSSKEFNTRSSN